MTTVITICALACVSSWLLTMIVRSTALRVGLLDHPDAHRKVHRQPIPLGGGLAIFLATVATIAVVYTFENPLQAGLKEKSTLLLSMLSACIVIVLVGLADDMHALRGRHKLIGQIVAVTILIWGGLEIRKVYFFKNELDLGPLWLPFTYFWLLGAINALNLLDGIDGLATSVGSILCLGIAGLSVYSAVTEWRFQAEAVVAVALLGSLLGFLRHNFPPASIFLGDAGSMLIGLVLGTLAISASLKGTATVGLAAPLAVWAIPAFDSAMAIVRRKLTGRSVYSTDRGHLHHCLQRHGFSNRTTVLLVAMFCSVTAAGGLASLAFRSDTLAVIAVLMVVGTLVVTGIFGRAEFMLVFNRLNAGSLFGRKAGKPGVDAVARHAAVRLQGNHKWNELWADMIRLADELQLSSLRFDLNLPFVHEGYHAFWERDDGLESGDRFNVSFPLNHRSRCVGRLESTCDWKRCGDHVRSGRLMALVELVEVRLQQLIEECEATVQRQAELARKSTKPRQTLFRTRKVREPVEIL